MSAAPSAPPPPPPQSVAAGVPGVNVETFAAQVRAQAMARHQYEAIRGNSKRCGCIAIALHCVLAVCVSLIFWATYWILRSSGQHRNWYSGYENPDYPWCMYVNWTVTYAVLGSVLFSLATFLPISTSCRVGPRWNMIVVGNLAALNILVWPIYALTACQSYWATTYGDEYCDFPWPIFVTMASVCTAVVTSAVAWVTSRPDSARSPPLVAAPVIGGGVAPVVTAHVVTGRPMPDEEDGNAK